MHIVIVGNSAAGLSAMKEIRKYDKKSKITVLSMENLDSSQPYYSPAVLPYYLDGTINERGLFFLDPEFYKENDIELHLGEKVVSFDPIKKYVVTDKNPEIEYDKLLIASGAAPIRLKIPGSSNPNVYVLRTYSDAQKIKGIDGKNIIILGGGPVGVESAIALKKIGKDVTIVEILPHILGTVFSDELSQLIEEQLTTNGIKILKNEKTEEILEKHGVGIRTSAGDLFGDALIMAIGVKANTSFVDGKLTLGSRSGILVNKFMETSVKDVFAAGDCTEMESAITGSIEPFPVWPNAIESGKIAGANVVGKGVEYGGGIRLNALNIFNKTYFSIGYVRNSDKITRAEKDNVVELYHFKNDKIVGAEIIGDVKYSGVVKRFLSDKLKGMADLKKFVGSETLVKALLPL